MAFSGKHPTPTYITYTTTTSSLFVIKMITYKTPPFKLHFNFQKKHSNGLLGSHHQLNSVLRTPVNTESLPSPAARETPADAFSLKKKQCEKVFEQ